MFVRTYKLISFEDVLRSFFPFNCMTPFYSVDIECKVEDAIFDLLPPYCK